MGADRLAADGSLGRAVFSVNEATVWRAGDGLDGTATVQLEILTTEGERAAYAEARVSRRIAGVGRVDVRGPLYDLTRQMVDDMNVEFEFQLRRTLRDYIQDTTTVPSTTAPVEREEL